MEINVLALAYIGDSIYEFYIRNFLIQKKIVKVNELQKEAIKYVSAKSQAKFLKEMMENNMFSEEELTIIKRARNHKSHASKTTDILTYKHSTALETLIGYLYYQGNKSRILEIMQYITG
ncbi:ribonuclease III [bacterium]|nr:ribonuclease III [bacterium]